MVYQKPVTFVEKMEAAAGNEPLSGIPRGNDYMYRRTFFGAQRAWPNDEVGWTRVPATKAVYRDIGGESVRMMVRVNRRDINRHERKQAGWNLLNLE
jgi:hypothetical protein